MICTVLWCRKGQLFDKVNGSISCVLIGCPDRPTRLLDPSMLRWDLDTVGVALPKIATLFPSANTITTALCISNLSTRAKSASAVPLAGT